MEALQCIPSQIFRQTRRRPEAQLCPFGLCWQRTAVVLAAPLPYRVPKHLGQSLGSARLQSRGELFSVRILALQHSPPLASACACLLLGALLSQRPLTCLVDFAGDRAQLSCQASQLQQQLALTLPSHSLKGLDDPACLQQPLWDLSEGLEAPVQLLYLLTLLGFLVVGAWLVVRQVLVRRDLEEAAKVLGERTRNADASSEVCK